MSNINNYEVLVGNIGLVHAGPGYAVALRVFNDYKTLSKAGRGRAAGEAVTLFKNGEPFKEFYPAPEPVKVYRDASAFHILIAQTSIMLAQFVDHFEQPEVEYLMMRLITGYGRQHPVWDLFDHPDKNIEVEVNEQSDRILLLTTPSNGWLKIDWSSAHDLSVTWTEPKS